MATDIEQIARNLETFYDFEGKSVIHVGAGGGHLIGYAARARSVLGVDSDEAAVAHLRTAIREKDLEDRFEVLVADFESVTTKADVVFFEFCLHEIIDPALALAHAMSLAPEILVLDHRPDSSWAWYTCETEKARRSWGAARELAVVREASYAAVQIFRDHAELSSKIQVLGEPAVSRIAEFAGQDDITIDMGYAAALLRPGNN